MSKRTDDTVASGVGAARGAPTRAGQERRSRGPGRRGLRSAGRDPRDKLFEDIAHARVTARVIAEEPGIVAGHGAVVTSLGEIGLAPRKLLEDGAPVDAGVAVAEFQGSPRQIAVAEERLIGLLAKPSGIATASARFVAGAGGRLRVVSGAWKKLPFSQREMIREAVIIGGAAPRIAEWPFLYIDKNFVRMHGGLASTMAATRPFDGWTKVVQIRGEYRDIGDEAMEATAGGASILFVDSGRIDDADRVIATLRARGRRAGVEVAFGGGVQLGDLARIRSVGVDIVDVGRPIVDAPLLDMRLDVVEVVEEQGW